jgi:YegS/Rv2252/BmrU family lipid kinase
MKSCTIICSANSGRGMSVKKQKALEKLTEYLLKEKKMVTDVVYTKYSGHATELAATVASDMIINISGDGGLSEIIKGVLDIPEKKRPIICHIPQGTANDYCYNMGIPKKDLFTVAKDIIENGKKLPLDTFYINDVNAFYSAGIGIFADIPYITSQKLKKKLGEAAYLLTGFLSIFKRIPRFNVEIEVNGKKEVGTYVLILATNSESIGGLGNILHNVDYSDGKFELTLLKYKNHMQVLKDLAKVIIEREEISKYKNFVQYSTDKVKIKFLESPNDHWCFDGEDSEKMSKGLIKPTEQNITIKIGPSVTVLIPNNKK